MKEGNFGLTPTELELFKSLNTEKKIQDFINRIPINFEEDGEETCYSPRMVLDQNKCHCIEGAILAALILRLNGYPPLVIDLTASDKDFDHVVAVFRKQGKWGAISKTNHATIRYREPVYNSIRELVMSYFNEYFNDEGKKTLRSYSNPVNLSIFDNIKWMTTKGEIWEIPNYLTEVKHFPILTKSQILSLRKADEVEITAGNLREYENNLIKKNF